MILSNVIALSCPIENNSCIVLLNLEISCKLAEYIVCLHSIRNYAEADTSQGQ